MKIYQINANNFEFSTSSQLCFFIKTEEDTTQYSSGLFYTGRQWVINDYSYCMNLIYRR